MYVHRYRKTVGVVFEFLPMDLKQHLDERGDAMTPAADITRPRCTMAHALQLCCIVCNSQTVSSLKKTYKNKFLDQTRT